MERPRLYVDFNEMLEPELVLLSAGDTKADVNGNLVLLKEGLEIIVFMDDVDENGSPDHLVAAGVVESNSTEGWGHYVKWCCRINGNGIRHESEL